MNFKKAAAGMLLAAFMGAAAVPARVLAQEPASPTPAVSQSATPSSTSIKNSLRCANELCLAYIVTSSGLENNTTQKGLQALANVLTERTAVEPAAVVGLDIEKDDLSFYPFIYWPVTAAAPALSEQARTKLQSYLNTGGMVLFDVRDRGASLNTMSPALQRILGDMPLRPLIPVTSDHTLSQSFYIVPSLRGSSDYGTTWVEALGEDKEKISSVIIGENNWAGAWAGTYLAPDSREREMALRSGVNMVMFAVMGNYKNDQSHLPTILKRLKKDQQPAPGR